MIRCRRRVFELEGMGGAPGTFDKNMPWDYVLRAVAEDETYWNVQFKETALLVLSQTTTVAAHLGGDAPIGVPKSSSAASASASAPRQMPAPKAKSRQGPSTMAAQRQETRSHN
eukprot:1696706-Amphidinium_carterae.1